MCIRMDQRHKTFDFSLHSIVQTFETVLNGSLCYCRKFGKLIFITQNVNFCCICTTVAGVVFRIEI